MKSGAVEPRHGTVYIQNMSEHRPKRPRDPAQLAKLIVDIATGEAEDDVVSPTINEGARRGGLKGGAARACKLAPEERRRIAAKAASARWKKGRPVPEKTE